MPQKAGVACGSVVMPSLLALGLASLRADLTEHLHGQSSRCQDLQIRRLGSIANYTRMALMALRCT